MKKRSYSPLLHSYLPNRLDKSVALKSQDGPQAGQTVPHVHIHIIPRKAGDFEKNDEIYDAVDTAAFIFLKRVNVLGAFCSLSLWLSFWGTR